MLELLRVYDDAECDIDCTFWYLGSNPVKAEEKVPVAYFQAILGELICRLYEQIRLQFNNFFITFLIKDETFLPSLEILLTV